MQKLIKEHTLKVDGLAGSRLDIVGNVVNLAPVYWVAEFIVRAMDLSQRCYSYISFHPARYPPEDRRQERWSPDSCGGVRHAEDGLRRRLPQHPSGEQLVDQQARFVLRPGPLPVHREGSLGRRPRPEYQDPLHVLVPVTRAVA